MSDSLYLVFSIPPDEVGDEEYNRWYEFHVGEVLAVPGIASARRYRSQTIHGDGPLSDYPYLALYEIDGDLAEAMAALDEAEQTWTSGQPDWCDRIRYSAWKCFGLSHEPHPARGARLVLAFTRAPGTIPAAEYELLQAQRTREQLELQGVKACQRFRLETSASTPSPATHIEIYEIAGDPRPLRAAAPEADALWASGVPDLAHQALTLYLDCTAVSDRVTTSL